MENLLFELMRPWAGITTWHTSHPTDFSRFYKVIGAIIREIGTEVDMDVFEAALTRHAKATVGFEENPTHWGF